MYAAATTPWLLLHWGYIATASWLCYARSCYGYAMAMLWPLVCHSPWGHKGSDKSEWLSTAYGRCISQREAAYGRHAGQERTNTLPSLRLLTSSSSLLAPALPTLSSANSVKSKTVGITNRINSVIPITEKKLNCYLQIRQIYFCIYPVYVYMSNRFNTIYI